MAMVMRFTLLWLLIMRVLAVHDMARHEVVHDFADDLDPKNAAQEAGDQNPRCTLCGETTIDQGTLCGRKHTI